MKRLSSTDSLGGLMTICPNSTDEHNHQNNPMYSREFQTMLEGLDEDGCIEESGHVSEKKRRLSVDQVKALEKNFEVENKLEPERKIKLAQELGLQPRQVAVWFQNRRARWKTKQLERDYGVLKASYDGLKLNFDKLQHDNESLLEEIRELKSKLNEDGNTEEKTNIGTPLDFLDKSDEDATEVKFEISKDNPNGESLRAVSVFVDFKDGSSDSDSSAILNEDNNSPTGIIHHSPHQFLNGSSSSSSASMNTNFSFSEMGEANRGYQPQLVKIEEQNFFGEECTTFFSDDQAPTLHWYCSDEWN